MDELKDDYFETGDLASDDASGDDESPLEDKKHANLLDSISALDGQKLKRSKLSERTFYAQSMTEFGFGQAKVPLNTLLGSLKNTESNVAIKNKLTHLKLDSKLAQIPLSTVESSKIERSAAYDKSKVELAKWNPVVVENRKAEQISFPLKQASLRLYTTDELKTQFKPRTPLELEIAALLRQAADSIGTEADELTPAEERALDAISLEEAKERLAELQKHRVLLSYKQAKAKRVKKIKSKQYHKILKKERLKKERNQMDELLKTDPEAYVEKMQALDRLRTKERMTLTHRGGSKFLKQMKKYRKYDEKSKEDVQNMIQYHKDLMQKNEIQESEEEKETEQPEESRTMDSDEDDIDDGTMFRSGRDNPWMKYKTTREKPTDFQMNVDNEDEGSDGEHAELTLQNENNSTGNEISGNVVKTKKLCKEGRMEVISEEELLETKCKDKEGSVEKKTIKGKKRKKGKSEQVSENISDDKAIDSLFDNLTDTRIKLAKKIEKKQKINIKKQEKRDAKIEKIILSAKKAKTKKDKKRRKREGNRDSDSDDDDDDDGLDLSLKRKQTLEDVEDEDGYKAKSTKSKRKRTKKEDESDEEKNDSKDVDPIDAFKVESTLTNCESVNLVLDDEDDDVADEENERKMTIAEAFEEDDVIEEFAQEKEDVAKDAAPKDIDITLPGWGSWGGSGLEKKKRMILKAPLARKRRDRKIPNVIINENVQGPIKKHQIYKLPFPFTSEKHLEETIKVPIGKNWNPETAFRKMIQPKVVTKIGTVIAPINKADVFKKEDIKDNIVEKKKIGSW